MQTQEQNYTSDTRIRDLESSLQRARFEVESFKGELGDLQVNMDRYEQLKNDNEELLKIQYVYNEILQKNGIL